MHTVSHSEIKHAGLLQQSIQISNLCEIKHTLGHLTLGQAVCCHRQSIYNKSPPFLQHSTLEKSPEKIPAMCKCLGYEGGKPNPTKDIRKIAHLIKTQD